MPEARVLAEESEGVGQSGVIGIACALAVDRGPLGEDAEEVGVGGDAELKPPHAPCGNRLVFAPGFAC